MKQPAWESVPLRVSTDPASGGRWTSLTTGEREWLWANPDPEAQRARGRARPGDPFVDAGGVEECLPTVRGRPDHGDVWARSWEQRSPSSSAVTFGLGSGERTAAAVLQRTVSTTAVGVQVDYEVTGPPGLAFVHAVHALLDLGPTARLHADPEGDAILLDAPAPGDLTPTAWPAGLDRLGPDDGSAICVLLLGCRAAEVVDGDDKLSLVWSADDPALCSLMVWRNLQGWPEAGPYRSIGIEPMVGRSADQSRASAHDLVRIGAAGVFRWSLTLSAYRGLRS